MPKAIEILLVEDNPADVRLTEEALKDTGIAYTLHVVGDGEEALSFLRRQGEFSAKPRPDVVLLDLNMPQKDGHEVLAEIRDDDSINKIPLVVLTVSQEDRDILKALDLKMNYYLHKPVHPDRLHSILAMIQDLWLE